MRKPSKYGPVESENIRVGTVDAESPEAREDDHGLAAMRKKRARGGKVAGEAPKPRLDRRARGGKVNGKGVKINVIVAPQGGGAAPMGPPPGAAPPPPTAIRPPPPNPMVGAMSGPGAQPAPMPSPMRKDGGRVPHLTGGAGGGEGRIEKAKAYGKNAKGAAG
jgi:hypothetical protein